MNPLAKAAQHLNPKKSYANRKDIVVFQAGYKRYREVLKNYHIEAGNSGKKVSMVHRLEFENFLCVLPVNEENKEIIKLARERIENGNAGFLEVNLALKKKEEANDKERMARLRKELAELEKKSPTKTNKVKVNVR